MGEVPSPVQGKGLKFYVHTCVTVSLPYLMQSSAGLSNCMKTVPAVREAKHSSQLTGQMARCAAPGVDLTDL